jgi:hypothetical protein
LFWANGADTESGGFHSTDYINMESDSHAITISRADIHFKSAWIWDWSNLLTFRIEAVNEDASKRIFIGVAKESDLESYLEEVGHTQITDFSVRPYEVDSVNITGISEPMAPISIPNTNRPPYEEFWTESAHGPGPQDLEFELEAEDFVITLMNDDGSAGIDLNLKLGTKEPLILGTAVAFLVAGIVALMLAVVMFRFARYGLIPKSKHNG